MTEEKQTNPSVDASVVDEYKVVSVLALQWLDWF